MVPVGQRLYEERTRKGLTIEDVSKATKIRPSFLLAIEKGQYSQLPSSSYAQGFVRNYATFLGLDGEKILALFRREFDERREFQVLPKGFERTEVSFNRFRIKDTFALILLVFLALLGYIVFQYRFGIINPPLEISQPKENESVSSQSIIVSGQTDSNATVFVNNTLVSLDQNGNFKKSIDVFPGKITIRIKAVNRFNKATEVDRHITVQSE